MGNMVIKPLPRTTKYRSKTESRYAKRLNLLLKAGEIVAWRYEEQKFNVGEKAWYCPDFCVLTETEIQFHEIKGGFIRPKGLDRFKSVMKQFWWYRWMMVQEKPKDNFTVILSNKG